MKNFERKTEAAGVRITYRKRTKGWIFGEEFREALFYAAECVGLGLLGGALAFGALWLMVKAWGALFRALGWM